MKKIDAKRRKAYFYLPFLISSIITILTVVFIFLICIHLIRANNPVGNGIKLLFISFVFPFFNLLGIECARTSFKKEVITIKIRDPLILIHCLGLVPFLFIISFFID